MARILTVDSLNVSFTIKVDDKNTIESVIINGKESKSLLSGILLDITDGSIFPEMHAIRKPEEAATLRPITYYRIRQRDRIPEVIESFLRRQLAKNIGRETLYELSHSILERFFADEKTVLSKSIKGSRKVTSWRRFIDKANSDDSLKKDFMNTIYMAILPEVMNITTAALKSIVTNSLYIGPARARSDRYYRYQDLSVSEIDPDGKNFPMFLNSLSPVQVKQLSAWIEKLYGYGLSVSRTEGAGHLSINLIEHGITFNIVDTGYGVSQILPVLAQIWWARERVLTQNEWPNTVSFAPTILAIEQPELHLHPAHQALLADAFVGEAASRRGDQKNSRVHFLIETHSETLINRLGELISEGRLDPDEVNIILFEPDKSDDKLSTTSVATFASDGSLLNWPYGFFQAQVM